MEIVLTGAGGPEMLRVSAGDAPEPGKGEVRVRVEASGVSFAEVQMLRRRYPMQPKFPFVPGYDLVGDVSSVGAGRDRRAGGRPGGGDDRDRRVAHARRRAGVRVVPVPAGARPGRGRGGDDERRDRVADGARRGARAARPDGAGARRVRRGRHAAGAAGRAAPAHGCWARRRRRSTTSSGRWAPSRSTTGRARSPTAVRALAPAGVDAVFDHVGGDSLPASYEVLADGGILVNYGSASTLHDPGHWLVPYFGTIRRFAGWRLARLARPGPGAAGDVLLRQGGPAVQRSADRGVLAGGAGFADPADRARGCRWSRRPRRWRCSSRGGPAARSCSRRRPLRAGPGGRAARRWRTRRARGPRRPRA